MSGHYYYPEGYVSSLSLQETEIAIKRIKDFFQQYLSSHLRLRRVTAPMFLKSGTGVNDDLNGVEKPVSFTPKGMGGINAEIPQSLAKWKRMMLADYHIPEGFGLYTDMNAIRADEDPDNLHSYYVDQWDWEKAIAPDDRNIEYLKQTVKMIYSALRATEYHVYENYRQITPILPEEITFLHAEDLCRKYPAMSATERESEAAKEFGAVFVIGIGHDLSDGRPHDGRAPDYDDWSTETSDGYHGLNGDIILWNPVLERTFEISSMGIRVSRQALEKQLMIRGSEERKELLFHRRLLAGEFPESIGGGIGQSRLCMFLLRKAHIGEVQASLWPDQVVQDCAAHGIELI